MIFRIDDVSLNTNMERLRAIVEALLSVPMAKVALAVSPMVHRVPQGERGRIFPKVMGAMSDHRAFFRPDMAGVPDLSDIVHDPRVVVWSHGLFHVDHRLLGREAQEVSILASCSVVGSQTYVAPFNKWNRDTESICAEHGIELVKWEDDWRHVHHNGYDPSHGKWYLHEHDTDPMALQEWLHAPTRRRTGRP